MPALIFVWSRTPVHQRLDSQLEDNQMVLSIRREMLCMTVGQTGEDIHSKWADNMQKSIPMDWFLQGDIWCRMNVPLTVTPLSVCVVVEG